MHMMEVAKSSVLPSILESSLPSPKRQKCSCDVTNEDRISKLPDSILCQILSFLPTRECVRTSVLSRTWRVRWTLVDTLDFDDRAFIRKKVRASASLRSFTNFVNRALILHNHPCIKRFRLYLTRGDLSSDAKIWISSAIIHNVEELHVSSTGEAIIGLPTNLFSCETIRVLKLHNRIELNVPEFICLQNLRVLNVEKLVCLCDATMAKLLSGCPNLEELNIQRHIIDDLQTLSVVSETLKRLTISRQESCFGLKHKCLKVVVDAPNLEFLELIEYHTQELEIITKNLSLVVNATIDVNWRVTPANAEVDKKHAGQAFKLLRQMCKLRSLSLSSYFLRYCQETIGSAPIFEVPECLTSSIEMLQLTGFKGSSREMQMIEYILKHSKALKEIKIATYYGSPSSERGSELLKKLLTFPRSSSQCQIVVC